MLSSLEGITVGYRYAYPVARVSARRSFLLSEKQLASIAEADNLEDAVNILSGTVYDFVSQISEELSIEQALNKNLVETLLEIHKFLPSDAQEVFLYCLGKYETLNIKSILAGVYAGLPKEEITKSIVPINLELTEHFYSDLASLKSVEDVVSHLEETPYGFLIKILPKYEETGLLLPLNTALDRFAYERAYEVASSFKGPDIELLKKMIGTEIDIINIKTILRLKAAGVKVDDIAGYLIPHGYELEGKLPSFYKLESIADGIEVLKNTAYYEPLSSALKGYSQYEISSYETIKRLGPFERALDEFYIRFGRTLYMEQSMGMGAVLRYVIEKTREIRNLITMLKLKAEGFSPEEIKKWKT
ncbi:MAG: V-type ATPase subunit [Candidatus Hydrothermarchaeales archaeon]